MRSQVRASLSIALVLLLALSVLSSSTLPSSYLVDEFRFKDVTKESGINPESDSSSGSTWADYNRDGYPDLLVGRHLQKARFYVNREGSFTKKYIADVLKPRKRKYYDLHACAWGEANRDDRVDLYCGSGARSGEGTGPNRLLIQKSDHFVERGRKYGVWDLLGRARSLNWLDYNGDGRLDLFVGNEVRRNVPNVMFRHGRRKFKRARVGLGTETETVSSTWADWNNDGRPDLLVLRRSGGAAAYENVRGKFVRVSLPNVSGKPWLSASWGDFNGDGRPDLVGVSSNRLTILRNTSGGFRPMYSRKLKHGRSAVWLDVDNDGELDLAVVQGARGDQGSFNHPDFLLVRKRGGFRMVQHHSFRGPNKGNGETASVADFDRDGRVDLFVSNGYACLKLCPYSGYKGPATLLRNRTRAGNSVLLELRGLPANPLAMGARLRVELNGKSYWRQLTDGVTFRAQSEINPVHLGLNRSDQARVSVFWPGGGTDCLTIDANSYAVLEKGSNPCSG